LLLGLMERLALRVLMCLGATLASSWLLIHHSATMAMTRGATGGRIILVCRVLVVADFLTPAATATVATAALTLSSLVPGLSLVLSLVLAAHRLRSHSLVHRLADALARRLLAETLVGGLTNRLRDGVGHQHSHWLAVGLVDVLVVGQEGHGGGNRWRSTLYSTHKKLVTNYEAMAV
jgi:hypothetical protein